MIDRYDIQPEGLGEINIDEDDNGEWCQYEDVKKLESENKKLQKQIAECYKYLSHGDMCDYVLGKGKCTCGLYTLKDTKEL